MVPKISFGIRSKAIMAITIFVICIVTILSVFFIKHEHTIIHSDLRQMGLVLANNLAYNAEYGVLTDNADILKNLIEGVMKQPQVAYCLIHDVDGSVLASRGLENNKLKSKFHDVAQLAVQSQEPLVQLIDVPEGEDYYDIAVPMMTKEVEVPKDEMSLFQLGENVTGVQGQKSVQEKKIGIVRIGVSLEWANKLEDVSKKTVTIITVFLILIAALLTTLFTGIAVVPIRKLVEGTQRIARGDLDFEVTVQGDDEIAQLAGSFNKMTADLAKSRDELLGAKEYTDNIIKSMVDILIVVNVKGLITRINPATMKLLGYKEDELLGQPVDVIVPGILEDKGPQQKITEHLMNKGYITDYEMSFKAKTGIRIPILLSGSVMHDKFGKVVGIVGIAKDITERKVAQSLIELKNKMLEKVNEDLVNNERALNAMLADLRKANEELKRAQTQLVQSEKLASIGQLAAGIAHEINNPLGFVGSNLSVLDQYVNSILEMHKALEALKVAVKERDSEKMERAEQYLDELEKILNMKHIVTDIDNLLRETQNGIERISLIVKDLRSFARQDREQKGAFSLNKIFEGVVNIVWSEIKYKADLKQELGDIPLIECNGQQIGQVFINLLVNAAQAIKDRGTITVRTYYREGRVYAEIEDTGEGIAPDMIDKIFDPFFSTKEVGKGTGLGLSISYEIIKNHNGDVKVKSVMGKGTVFILSFPAIAAELSRKKGLS